jgi:hypothetical protein
MKKNKGFLMGIAALALLFSMTFPACESATGAAGDPGNSQEWRQNFTISSDFSVVIPDSAAQYIFGAWYEGVNIVPKETVEWKVTGTGGAYDETNPGKDGHHTSTGFGSIITSTSNILIVDTDELAESLTVTATYGGYTATKTVIVGVPRIPGLKLQKGSEISTTNITDANYLSYVNADGTKGLALKDTYLVYTIDDKELTELRRDTAITPMGTAKVNPNSTADVDYNIPIGQEKWLTIYEVPLSGGESKEKHVTALRFFSTPATKHNSVSSADSFVYLPLDATNGHVTLGTKVEPTVPTFTALPGSATANLAISGTLLGTTADDHGNYSATYTAYAVYYDPSIDYGTGGAQQALNTRFIQPSGSPNFSPSTPSLTLNKTGVWQIIVQYTGTAHDTQAGAWSYAGTVEIKDASPFNRSFTKTNPGNVVHITVEGKTFKDDLSTATLAGYFTLGAYAHVSRDSDTAVTLYLTNDARTATTNTVAIDSRVFNLGTPPKDDAVAPAVNDFISVTISDQKFTTATIGGISPLPFTFTAGNPSPNVTVGATAGFPYGEPNTSIDEGVTTTPGVVYTITWYYVDGSTWTPTGTTGPSFTPLPEDKGRTLGIRASVEGNYPYVTLIDVIPGVAPNPVDKWRIIDYGQRILGAVSNL